MAMAVESCVQKLGFLTSRKIWRTYASNIRADFSSSGQLPTAEMFNIAVT